MHKRIRDLREANNYRQIDIAEKLNMSQQQYQKYESGIVTPSINILVSIADLYNVSVDFLLGRTNYKKVVQSMYIAESIMKHMYYVNKHVPL